MLADADGIARLERHHLHALAVDESSVHAAEILEHEPAFFVEHAGVVVRDGGIVDHQAVFRRAADAYLLRANRHFLQHRVFEFQHKLWHVSPPHENAVHGLNLAPGFPLRISNIQCRARPYAEFLNHLPRRPIRANAPTGF